MSAPPAPEHRIAIAAGFRLQWEAAQEAYVLLYPEGMVSLNESAAQVLKRCDGARTVAEIIADLEQQFPGADLTADVLEFLGTAHERGWIRIA